MKGCKVSRTVRIGLVQLAVKDGDINHNISNFAEKSRLLERLEPDIIVLPEFWTTGYEKEAIKKHAEVLGSGRGFLTMAWVSREYSTYVAGAVPVRRSNGITDTMLLLSPEGELIAEYNKIHLFRLYREHEILKPGDKVTIVDTRVARLGLEICYDLRFPELSRCLSEKGAEILLVSASWGAPRLGQWMAINQARAAENQVYIASANRFGESVLGEMFPGHSMIVDPWGDLVGLLGWRENIGVFEIDLERISIIRNKLPIWSDRRPKLYDEMCRGE